jgi:hypothetical protein
LISLEAAGVKFEFGDVQLDEDTRQLRRKGAVVHLSPKGFDLLVTLVRERPRVLSKADLHARLWPQVFVSVRTVHRHGYAFQGHVRDLEETVGYWVVTDARQALLNSGENFVGRDPKLGVWLDSPSVSRRHACIRVDGDTVTLEDLNSKNGTFARDERITGATVIQDGDELRFGSVKVTLKAWSSDPTRSEAGGA